MEVVKIPAPSFGVDEKVMEEVKGISAMPCQLPPVENQVFGV